SNLEPFAQAVERLVAYVFAGTPFRHFQAALCDEATRQAGRPPVLAAAQQLDAACHRGSRVLIGTGFVCPPTVAAGETDGPPGVIALVYAWIRAFGAEGGILAETEVWPALIAGASAAELDLGRAETPTGEARAVLVPFSRARETSNELARRMLAEWPPAALIA